MRRRCFLGRAIEIRHVSRRDGDDPKGGVISVSDTSTPLAKQATLRPQAICADYHVANAASDMVFTQYEPVLRAAKGK